MTEEIQTQEPFVRLPRLNKTAPQFEAVDAAERVEAGFECSDWYLCKKNL